MDKLDQLFVINLMATEVERKNLERQHGKVREGVEEDAISEKEPLGGRRESNTNTDMQEYNN